MQAPMLEGLGRRGLEEFGGDAAADRAKFVCGFARWVTMMGMIPVFSTRGLGWSSSLPYYFVIVPHSRLFLTIP